STDPRMLVPLFALQPARGRRSDRRSDPACLAGASPQDHGWEACGGEAVHEPRWHHSDLIESADKGDLNTCATTEKPDWNFREQTTRRKCHDQGSHAKRLCGRPSGGFRYAWGLRATDHRAGIGHPGAGTHAGGPPELCAGDDRTAEEAGGRQLADVPPHL